jgi:hypothetical protein
MSFAGYVCEIGRDIMISTRAIDIKRTRKKPKRVQRTKRKIRRNSTE